MDSVIEIIGYLASSLVAVSFLMKSMKKLRLINTVGAVFFVIYSYAIKAWPVAAINLFIVIINIYHISKDKSDMSSETDKSNNQA
jgi:uncharacterized protein with PQ loop repeat